MGFTCQTRGASVSKASLHSRFSSVGDVPAQGRAAQAHAHQVALRARVGAVGEALAAVQHGQVVDEVHVAGLGLDLQLGGPGNGLDGVQSLKLAGRDGRQVRGARMGSVAHEGGAPKFMMSFPPR